MRTILSRRRSTCGFVLNYDWLELDDDSSVAGLPVWRPNTVPQLATHVGDRAHDCGEHRFGHQRAERRLACVAQAAPVLRSTAPLSCGTKEREGPECVAFRLD